MSQQDINRLQLLEKIANKQLTQVAVAKQLNISARHLRRIQRAYKASGAHALISKRRGKASNNRLSDQMKVMVINLVREHYVDFGPTFAREKLNERHGIAISVESLRQLMIGANIWVGKKRKQAHIHPMRTRRSQYGELVQIDGSPHAWFEERSPTCCLLVFIDDATSQLMVLHFVEQECCAGYFTAMEKYIERYGKPLSLYSDRHGIFRVNIPEAKGGNGQTQFGRAMQELNIELICANSPQAKGRVERANSTLQDRLVKELRLRNISDMNTANAFMPDFIEDHNNRFTVIPADPRDAHRTTSLNIEQRQRIFSHQEQRKISKNLEVSYHNVIYQIQTDKPSYNMRRGFLTVCDRENEITLLYKNKVLPYKIFDSNNRPTVIADSKEISRPVEKKKHKPQADHPWKKSFSTKVSATHQQSEALLTAND